MGALLELGLGVCSRCGAEARLTRQRWGRRCLTAAQRARRAAARVRRQEANQALLVLLLAPAPAEPWDQPAGPPSSVVADQAGGAAVAAYHRACAALDQAARTTDWRRSRYTPAAVLRLLHAAVTRAEAECRRLGVPDAALRQP